MQSKNKKADVELPNWKQIFLKTSVTQSFCVFSYNRFKKIREKLFEFYTKKKSSFHFWFATTWNISR
jgi:hypothetical protein